MTSIRHTLIVYFLALLTVALAAVSWFCYRTTSQALRERQLDSQQMIETQCEASCQAARADLDRRILRQAQTLANMSRSVLLHSEGVLAFGAVGAAVMPQGYLNIPLWLAEGTYPPLAFPIFRSPQLVTHVELADALTGEPDYLHEREYFQTYRSNGQPMQRSVSMGEVWFQLDQERRDKFPLLTEFYDDVDLKPGVTVRRVTLKWTVPRYSVVTIPWPWRGGIGMPPNMKGKGPIHFPPRWSPPRFVGRHESVARTVFFQYASDRAPTEAKILAFQRQRDEKLAQLTTDIEDDLRQLRGRMFAIALAMLAAIWLGGYGLVRLGLAPLSKMSEAVSQVSPQNFHLPLDANQLPQELQPIAARLAEVLEHLRNAFAREKQAAADISHELRTPLAALMTTLEVGLRKTRSSAEYREILEECRASGQHMYQLVERLLTLARLDAGADQYRASEVDAVDVALQCADLIRPLAKARGLELRLHLPDPVALYTDPNKLREVLTNLLHNAVEYNRPNGSIELSIERESGQVKIEVRDTGIGIKPEARERIFERFFRADPSRHADTPHAGLGLAIVKSYIDLMQGTIRVASSDAGTVFTVALPRIESAPELEAAIPGGDEPFRRERGL